MPAPRWRYAVLSAAWLVLTMSGLVLSLGLESPSALAGRTAAAASRPPPVVLLTVDEMSVDALRGRDGRVDAIRYPNFAALARQSTWFRNTVAATPWTFYSMPAILDGRIPAYETPPEASVHPVSLFTALAARGYGIVDAEEATRVCPRRLCPNISGHVDGEYGPMLRHPHRVRHFLSWVRSIRRRHRPTFWMTQLSLPHQPWVYMPSGRLSRPRVPGEQYGLGYDDRYVTDHNRQRFLLQLQFTDRLLGRLLAQLRRQKMLGEALVVVAGDHGYSFTTRSRRLPRPENLGEIGPVVFFVKAPHQRRPRIDDHVHRNLDVAPTVADVLNLPLGYPTDGRSAFLPTTAPAEIQLPPDGFPNVARIPYPEYLGQREAAIRRRIALFGTGRRSLFAFGPHRRLVGRRLSRFRVRSAARVRARLVAPATFRHVRRAGGVMPCSVAARVDHGRTR